ncbi:DUF4298 domain-containing protein [Facklamia miroungae]|uniref:DUF4298 domain-containing protein n=1 Tax=Facklamia miroungae TaxID=120956 RepID=A0A1G7U2F7_9LACT|nr:DUF4298 domain-containing protein [Facklamia miroungae]NKZ29863.1 DUF4298 domain-containing protein [Facklamia miroungae]SDG41229.1 protein of unknown function [Facklamia miroungae]
MNKIDHFIGMEKNYLSVDQSVNQLMEQLDAFQAQQEKIAKLINYYGSPEWYEHLEMEKEELLPNDSTRAVLGEDYAYETLGNLRQCAIQMLELSTHIFKIY